MCEVDPLRSAGRRARTRSRAEGPAWVPFLWRNIHGPPGGYPSRKGGPAMKPKEKSPFDPKCFSRK